SGQIIKILQVEDSYHVLSPLRSGGEVTGILQIQSTDLVEHFIPTVKIFGVHISNTLDLVHAQRREEKARKALQENEKLQENIFSSLEDGIFILDREFHFTYWNPAMWKFTGKGMEDVVGSGKSAFEIFPQIHEQGLEKLMWRAMKGEVVSQEEIKYPLEENEEGYISLILVPLRTSTNGIQGIVGLVREITERKRTQDHLRITEEKYKLLVENANEAIVVAQNGVIKFSNPKASEITGYSPTELDQRPITDLIHPDDIEMVLDRHRRRTEGEEIQNVYTFRIIARSGQTKCVEINAVSFNWEGQQSTLNFLTDVTERKRAEEALLESEEKWRSWVENAPDKITTLDREGKILYLNHVPQGFDLEEVLGNRVYDYLGDEEKSRMRIALEKTFGFGRVTSYESAFIGADGSTVYFDNSVGPVKKGGRVVEAILISRDITERKRAEAALKNSEERMHALFETMAEGVIVLNSEGRIVEANDAAERILSIDRSRVKNSDYVGPDWEAIRPDGSSMPISEIPSAVAMRENRPVKDVVMGIKRTDAPVVWLSVSAVPFSRMAGEETGVVTTFSDITKWKKIREDLGQKTEYFEKILDVSPAAIAVTDEAGVIVECNQAILDLHGFESRNQILGKTVFSLTPEDEHERVKIGFANTKETGSVRLSPLKVLGREGKEIQVELTGRVIGGYTGSPGRFIAILRKFEEGETYKEQVDRRPIDVEA
ncbi:MAG: PAS domain S-box protein, partial [Theionarchaea archaeon]|nr:PAS domain S-box protein [Theionarchaea archaeon]